HNTFDDIIDNDADELAGAVNARFGPASLSGALPADTLADLEPSTDAETAVDTFMVLANVPQGRTLRNDAEKLGIERNLDVGGKLIVASADSRSIDMGNGLRFTVIGPMLPEVQDLQKQHDKWVKDNPDAVRATPEALASYVDASVPNLSSIVVLAETKGRNPKRILFTGDARGDKILEGLELVGLVERGGSIRVDVLKAPHHGSSNNVEQDFFERIIAHHYVFSGNGEHGNPERETLEMLAAARGDDEYRIHLTYPVADIDVERKKDWDKHRTAEVARRKKNPAATVRAEWSDATNSLTAFLADNPDVNDKVVVVGDDGPHTIDLLGER
ncbi:MAG: hypothetical protein JWR37_2252, partial [Mycobacterium sp.]|nr:hypothetical protein [Mycobacterium sp.]